MFVCLKRLPYRIQMYQSLIQNLIPICDQPSLAYIDHTEQVVQNLQVLQASRKNRYQG